MAGDAELPCCHSDHSSNAGEEDEEQESAVQASIFEQYLTVCDEAAVDAETDALFARGLVRVQEYLSSGRDHSRCLICLGSIKPTDAVWGCASSCFALFHLSCIQEWGRNQLESAAAKAARTDPSTAASLAAREWGCPKCRFAYRAGQLPAAYNCFCGKKEDPEWDPWLAPHSCGELCGKALPGRCAHSCLLLCHPGPCPPCPLLVDAACYCGKAVVKQRCGNNEYSCTAVCGKRLPCGHACPELCHPGECGACTVVGSHKCACGAESSALPCWQSDWHCAKPCNKLLACGRHHCDQVCHAGRCGPCPEEGERRCPCGKARYTDLKCDEKASVCGSTCGKLLDCRVHTCQERCHYGPCNRVCRELVPKPCRCGRTEKQVLCSADVRCDSKCNATRACGRHPCKRRCCDGNCPPCEEVCNRKLRCGNHRCPAPCHSGPCRPCPLSQTVSCACAKTSYTLPCGAEAGALPPRCSHRCPVPAVCRHAADPAHAKPHKCHYGPCPPCRAPCGSVLPCGHSCASGSCHDAAPPPVPVFQQPKPPKFSTAAAAAAAGGGSSAKQQQASGSGGRESPEQQQQQQADAPAVTAAAGAAAMAAAGGGLTPCPACPVPVSVGCVGGHGARSLPCCSAAPFSCGARCGRPLACGNHSCSKACHVPASGASASAAGAAEACEVCTRACDKPRSCRHPCPSRCHGGPCEPCNAPCSIDCHCGKMELSFPCWQQQRIAQQQAQKQKQADDPLCCGELCGLTLPRCPHACAAKCHAGPCPGGGSCSEEVAVRCSCRRLKERWACSRVQAALAAAGGSSGSSGGRLYDGSSALKLLPCDAQCAAAAKDKQQQLEAAGAAADSRSQQASPTPQELASAGAAAAADNVAVTTTAASSGKGSKKLSRAEREALAAAKEEEWARQEQRQRLVRIASVVALVLGVVCAGVGLARVVDPLLQWIDGLLRAKYSLEAAQEL